MIFPEAVTELSAYRRFADAARVPILANITEFGVTPLFTVHELAGAGVGIALYPLSAFRAMNAAAFAVFETLRRDGTQKPVVAAMRDARRALRFPRLSCVRKKLDALFSKDRGMTPWPRS